MGISTIEEREKDLSKKMSRLKIYKKDIKETFIKSSGPGGQNVNKVATCVELVHVPTGIRVKCQIARTQNSNREKAKKLLVEKIEKKMHDQKQQLVNEKERLKRQNRKRLKAKQEEILQDKHRQSEKKETRKRIDFKNIEKYI
ncbi:MAG: hypothetical protein A2Y03_07620 [Omnitrophica WOR_2 bacterium GWF2_38_59]|nr:MAG: hypothetical protein A2Y06_07735 [Omnitrophica WOR_2 bacterium GWA2_37_7]OGX26773.1 MAG: hypothetical protein A2Y03_07620 [Omnitrophica WOR_2 bacterium GWF2_38_59]OGX49437.1 MAG: hypothetical protein A2243_09495 [Omnitrophica WOR_2 bacterium RIFOXYA2_FULL_38_17]OGX54837.1 MAG: hypothetical protein A2267_07300 [Omnitrophica WOR_2 bacterium RIFOXYA12_FULL_38_10]OGX55942.1 MAG: hypothetical protein A2306_12420 [Omnitrophica WOR_2 bacterium RIFOXYB2_FULL_38_16]OGX57008.1 MAG: hypothetical 